MRTPPGDLRGSGIGRDFEPDADRAGSSSRPQRLAQSAASAPILTSFNLLHPITGSRRVESWFKGAAFPERAISEFDQISEEWTARQNELEASSRPEWSKTHDLFWRGQQELEDFLLPQFEKRS